MPSTTPCNECHKHEMWEDQSYRNNTIYQNNLWIKYSFLVNDFDISQLFLSVVIFFRWNSAVFCMYFWIVWSFSINWHLVYCNFKAILSSRMNWGLLGWGMDTSCTNWIILHHNRTKETNFREEQRNAETAHLWLILTVQAEKKHTDFKSKWFPGLHPILEMRGFSWRFQLLMTRWIMAFCHLKKFPVKKLKFSHLPLHL